ncbi:Proline-rich family protein [Quillaja saponaria]|uniref:Proline-rich family protein n=1 Tax=Quillaja saponaria TaxID=32244 RepID=A0AAD7L4G0_QUISA|nr:Proline-rich family protein [Quillaja saponaria]
MPPSPALRCSPGRELRSDSHRRGRSLESGLLFKDKDEDLTLFSEMQSKERESFLLQSTDDFEDTFSAKLRHFSDIKLGISVPVRGESSDLLNADGEKNDYDWLLTPPDTPLFPSLDDEPPPVSIASRGRPQSKPISISRSSTMEKSYRSSRGSASPNRLSPSPRSGSNAFQSRGRPSSAPHSSPTPSLRHGTPSRKPSPPPSKASTPAPRSSTPTPRRISTGSSSATVSSGVRGTSPMKTSRGTSASPKIRAWQMNIPGFSSEAPPNLRTSLADRPASYVRGSSPASRNSRGSSPASRNCRDSTSKFSRQSMSPTASRSGSSFHTHDRDQLSSHSKGSIASSVEDDVDPLQSIQVGSLDRLASRRVSPSSNNRALTYSKKSARMMSSNSAPKRSFDSALRQMDHRKSPQNMFRPLLSSVPSTTFYVGKSNSTYRPLVSRNSSVTTSSNASSDQGTSFAPDTEGSDPNLDDMASESDKLAYPDHPEEVFSFDKMDVVDENIVHEMEGSLDIHHGELNKGSNIDYGPVDYEDSVAKVIYKNCKASQVEGDISELGNFEDIAICSRCGCQYDAIDQEDKDSKVCEDCSRKCALLRVIVPETFIVGSESSQVFPVNKSAEEKPAAETEPVMDVPEFPEDTNMGELWCSQGERAEENQTSCSELIQNHMQENPLSRSLVEEGQQILANQQEMGQPTLDYTVPNNEAEGQQFYHSNDRSNLNVDISEGTGISVLLKRSSSIKEPVIRGRPFTASTVPYGDLSFARDSANSMRGSSGHRSFSPSSSVDFSSSRQTEIHVQRQFSGSKLNIDFYGYDINLKPQSIGSSFSGTSNHSHQGLDLAGRTQEDSSCNMRYNIVEETPIASQQEQASEYVRTDTTDTSLMSSVLGKDKFEHNELGGTVDAYRSELSSQAAGIQPMDISETSFTNHKDCTSYGNDMDLPSISRSTSNVEVSVMTSRTSFDEEHGVPNTSIDEVDAGQIAANSFLIAESEKERENRNSPDPLNDDLFLVTKSTMDHFQEISGPDPSNDDLTTSTADAKTSENSHSITEESSIMVECRSGSKARSLTLEEATDTILFCSSIIHGLAYQAATIAMEKENSVPLEASRPMVTVLGKSNADRKNSRSRVIGKRTLKSPKTKQRRVEIDEKPPPIKMENDENRDESLTSNVGLPNKVDTSMKPPKLESKCNCTIM